MSDEEKPKRSWLKVGCFGVLGLFALLIVIGMLAPEPTPEQLAERAEEKARKEAADAEERQAEAQAKLDSATAITSVELARAYESNEVRAQQTYGDRDLLVTGRVTGVTLDFMDKPVVQLSSVNEFLSVQADLNDKSVAAGLDKGQTITILCTEVTEVVSAPQLSGCELIEG